LPSVTVTKHLRGINLKEKGLLWLMVSEVSVHSQSALLFLGHSETKHDGGEGGEEQSCSPPNAREAKRGETARDKIHHSPVTYFFVLAPSSTFHQLPITPLYYESINGLIP
jgi:hypothetical protein